MPSTNPPPQTNIPYVPSTSVGGISSLAGATTGSPTTEQQQYVISMGWLAVLRMAAGSMIQTPRLSGEGQTLLDELNSIQGSAVTATIGSGVSLPASLDALVHRSSSKHFTANAVMRARAVVQHLGRPQLLAADTLVTDPKTKTLGTDSAIARTHSTNLTVRTYVQEPPGTSLHLLNLGTKAVVQRTGRTVNLATDSAVATVRTLNLTSSSAVQAAKSSPVAVVAAVAATMTSSLTSGTVVAATITKNLTTASAVQAMDVGLEVELDTVVRSSLSLTLGASSGVAIRTSRDLGVDVVVGLPEFAASTTLLSTVGIMFQGQTLSCLCDCNVDDVPFVPLETLATMLVDVVVFDRCQLNTSTYVVPVPRQTWILASTVVKAAKTLSLSTSVAVV